MTFLVAWTSINVGYCLFLIFFINKTSFILPGVLPSVFSWNDKTITPKKKPQRKQHTKLFSIQTDWTALYQSENMHSALYLESSKTKEEETNQFENMALDIGE